jgi:hypothetical protein
LDRFTNILKQRLEATQSAPTSHPSSDALAAFVERGLTSSQRETVLTHLSVCPECREAVALATPEAGTATAQARPYSFSRALQFPVAMRWASLAAALAVAVGVGVIAHEHEPRQQLATFSAPQEKATPSAINTATQPNENMKSDSLQSSVGKSEAPRPLSQPAKPAARNAEMRRDRVLAKKQAETGGIMSAMVSTQPSASDNKEKDKYQLRAKTLPSAPEAQLGFADTRAAEAERVPAPAAPLSRSASASADNRISPDINSNMEAAKAKPSSSNGSIKGARGTALLEVEASPMEITSPVKPMNAVSVPGAKARRAYGMFAFVHWTISAAGQLQRRAVDGTLTIVEPVKGAIIRAVAAEGIEVWAGGLRSAPNPKNVQPRSLLFHSSDAGETWKTIDGPWQGSIERVNLAGLGSLTVVTTDGTWNTGDGGKSWSKP